MDTQKKTVVLSNHGVVLKKDPSQLQDGQYPQLLNVTSLQEESLSIRLGSRKYPNSASLGLIDSLAKLRIGSTDSANPRYAFCAGNLQRITGPYSSYTQVNAGISLGSGRTEAVQYNAGSSGDPYIFFANPGVMLKDNGAYAPLHPWGYFPPTIPVTLGLANPSLAGSEGLVVETTQAGGSARISGVTLSSVTEVNNNYYSFTPSSMNNILPGMLVFVGGVQVLIDGTNVSSFFGYMATTPSPGASITSFYDTVITKVGGGTVNPPVADGSAYYSQYNNAVDWSLSGTAANGYSSDDNVHVGINLSSITDVQMVQVLVFVNGSSTDYYEATLTLPQSQVAGAWFEVDTMKSTFVGVGLAGSGAYSWKNVTGVRVLVTSNNVSGTPTFTAYVGAIYAQGNQGPNSEVTGVSQPYNYLYTFRNPLTGAESNPCVPQVLSSYVSVQNQAVQVTVFGCGTANPGGQPDIQGFGSIAIYRAGGVFADGYYRFVGYSTNPGILGNNVPNSITFVDNQADAAIATNRLIAMDNYPPVVSNLPIPFAGTVASITLISSGSYAGLYQVYLQGYPGYGTTDPQLSTFFGPGSTISIGNGTNVEQCVVIVVGGTVGAGTNYVTVFLQESHYAGDQVTCDFRIGQPCDIALQVADNILLAGDPYNPHVVSLSKSGNPESFPVEVLATGIVNQMNVGSPSNPVYGLVEFNGEIVSLNQSSVYTFYLIQGQMTPPNASPANRGMFAKHCWCRVDNAIWYLSYDGIYAWSGGESAKVTEPINPIFTGQTINGYVPLDYTTFTSGTVAPFSMSYYENYVWVTYIGTDAKKYTMRYSTIYKRWEPIGIGSYGSGSSGYYISAMLTEQDTGRLIAGVYENSGPAAYLYQMESGTTDANDGGATDGIDIAWSVQTPNYTLGDPGVRKQFTDILVEVENVYENIQVSVYEDNSSTPTTETTITTGIRRVVPIPLNLDGSNYANGFEAYAVSFLFSGATANTIVLHSLQIFFNPLAPIQQGRIMDWSDIGHPYDKRLYEVTIEYNTYGQSGGVLFAIDTLSGINGNTYNAAVQTFTLTGNQRSKITIPIVDGTIAKMVRLRSVATGVNYQVFSVSWHKENYPADTTLFTEYSDVGYPYQKYVQQVVFDVNTNGVAIPVGIDTDGTIAETLSVTATLDTRKQIFTLNPALPAFNIRILINPANIPAGGQFQLWSVNYIVQPVNKGPVGHSFGWDDLGHLYDKKLQTVTFEWENAGSGVVINVDTLSGINGGTDTTAAMTFTLTGNGRSKKTFPIPDGMIVKMVKVYPATSLSSMTNFNIWGYHFTKIDYPPDTVNFTDWDDFGYEHLKIIQEIAFDVDTNGVSASVQILSDQGQSQTLTVTATNSTREQIVTLNPEIVGKKFQLLITPGSGGKFQLFGWKPKFEKQDPGPVSHSFSWDDLGHIYDKKLITVAFEWQNAGSGVVMQMDTLTGIGGNTQNTAVQTFTLTGNGRAKANFPISNGVIAKMVRVYPQTSSIPSNFGIWGYKFTKIDYPPDTVYFTEWNDFGYEHEKIIQEIAFDVDTNNVAAAVEIVSDEGTTQTVNITSTNGTRDQIVTLNPEIVGKKFQLLITPGSGGKFQLFDWKPKFIKNDPGPVEHSFSWDDLGWPYDKLLQTVVIEYDVKGSPVTMHMDTITGDGTVQNINVQQFLLKGPTASGAVGRSKVSFPITAGTIAKMVRLYPVSDTTLFQMWGYKFTKVDYPPDTVLSTDWEDLGYGCDKVFRVLTIDADTGGIPATVNFQVDGVTRYTFTMTTTSIDRQRIITLPSNPGEIMGRMARLVFTPGAGGKFQLFSKQYQIVREPCAVTQIDTLSIVLGQAGWKFIKQIWMEYVSAVPVTFSIFTDNNQVFYTATLPAQTFRDVQRFYLPNINEANGVVNKSKRYRFLLAPIDGVTPFKFYYDGSRIEYRALAGDQRTAYQQFVFSETLSPTGSGT